MLVLNDGSGDRLMEKLELEAARCGWLTSTASAARRNRNKRNETLDPTWLE